MPTYSYACTQCGHQFEAVQSFSDSALTECPECTGTLRKQYGTIGVTFNGGGFYRTDSRATPKTSSAESSSSASSKSDSKPAAAPAASS